MNTRPPDWRHFKHRTTSEQVSVCWKSWPFKRIRLDCSKKEGKGSQLGEFFSLFFLLLMYNFHIVNVPLLAHFKTFDKHGCLLTTTIKDQNIEQFIQPKKTHKKTNKQKKPRESLFLDLGDQALRGKIEMSTALGSPSLEGRYMDSCLSSLMGEIWLSPSRLPSELSEEC